MHNSADKLYIPTAGTMPARVADFFLANPDEELTATDIAEKFETESKNVGNKLGLSVASGLLQFRRNARGQGIYAAGPRLTTGEYPESAQPAASPPPAPQRAPTALAASPFAAARVLRQKAATQPVDFDAIQIEHGVPLPGTLREQIDQGCAALLARLTPGDSARVPASIVTPLRRAIKASQAQGAARFKLLAGADHTRVWRTE